MSTKWRSRGRSKRPRAVPMRPIEEIVITKIAQHGDGEGRLSDGLRVFVPLTQPGDRLRVQPGGKRGDGLVGTVIETIEQQPRKEPICPVFGRCGGCQLQHLEDNDYQTWKSTSLVTALSRHGLDAEISPLRQVAINTRRRATLALVMAQAGPVLGFNEAYSDRVVGMDGCPLLVPALAALWVPVRNLCADILETPCRADIAMTAVDAMNVDVCVMSDVALDLDKREKIAAFAEAHDIARISWQRPGEGPEPVSQRRAVALRIGKAEISLPGGGFLQPSKEGEAVLQELVADGVADAKHVADLYCGIGTFTLSLASAGKHVLAVDDNPSQIAALDQAAGRAGLGGHIRTSVRDLKESPLEAAAFNELGAVVFDPPRAGAKAQAESLADSQVPVIVAVSCNPATMARDLRILVDGGYSIEKITPVDQFPMSYHVEAVAVLRRTH